MAQLDVEELLRAVLRAGDERGVEYLRRRHVEPAMFDQLADLTHAHAWAHGDDDDVPGWRVYRAGINGWWQQTADLTDRERYRLHKFRSDLVEHLAQEGRAERPHPRGTALRVRSR